MAVIDQVENDLLACLCAALADEGRPVCECYRYPGGERAPADVCGRRGVANGQAWVSRFDATWTPASDRQVWGGGFCASASAWLTTIEVGVYRCVTALVDEAGNVDKSLYPLDRDLLDDDSQTLLRVLCCPVWDEVRDVFVPVSATLERVEPTGACMGVVLRLVVSGDISLLELPEVDEGFVSGPAG